MTPESKGPPKPKNTTASQAVQSGRLATIWKKEHKPVGTAINNKSGH